MKNNKNSLKFLLIGIIAFTAVYLFPFNIFPKITSSINDLPYWYIYFFGRDSISPLKIVGVIIDDYSLNKIPHRWPWRRSVYADLIKVLDAEGAKTIGFDLIFKGNSENEQDDVDFVKALDESSADVVLAFSLNRQVSSSGEVTNISLMPLAEFAGSAHAVAVVNTPEDRDGRVRRLYAYKRDKDKKYYSFSVELVASFLGLSPKKVLQDTPLLNNNTFLINYMLKPDDIKKFSFYDVLTNIEELKNNEGDDFLKNTLVLVYQEDEVLHDVHMTPLGKMPGGMLHINGIANMLLGKFMRHNGILSVAFLTLSFAAIFYILSRCGFLSGLLFSTGVVFLNFWALIILRGVGIGFDFSRIVVFGILFFIAGSIYKYAYFLAQLLKIKDRATIDPLRGVFTLRYFYYRLELELKKIYFSRSLYLVYFYLDSFKSETANFSPESLRKIWQHLRGQFVLKNTFWALYSQEELVGCVASTPDKIEGFARSLKNNFGILLKEEDIKVAIKVGVAKLKREYSIKELLFVLSKETTRGKDEMIFFMDKDITALLSPVSLKIKDDSRFLDILDADIEEKNRQLLALIEDLNKEHIRNQEIFFNIISSLVNAVETRDPYTEGHSERVGKYALLVAEELDWSNEEKEKLRKAALLHDLGKIGVPDRILHKKDRLNDEEYDFIKKHTVISVKILEPLKELKEIVPWIMYHHERWDGKGYPHGLGGNAIPLASQIIAFADTFDAITTGRDYKSALSHEQALAEISKNKGTQFNPELVDVFVRAILTKNHA